MTIFIKKKPTENYEEITVTITNVKNKIFIY